MTTRVSWPDSDVAADLAMLRDRTPLTHCLTNLVAAGFTANVLLALGASPAMVENDAESAEFASVAGGVLANLGTLSAERERALRSATEGARAAATPWVLDPVAAGALRHRTSLAQELMRHRPAIVRGNASEVLSLAGVAGAGGRGVDSAAEAATAVADAREFAATWGCVVAISGAEDYLTDGDRVVAVGGGDVLMTRVTGVGCALGATMAAFLAVSGNPLRAAVSASVVFGEAGRRAARECRGPGGFAVAFLDALFGLEDR